MVREGNGRIPRHRLQISLATFIARNIRRRTAQKGQPKRKVNCCSPCVNKLHKRELISINVILNGRTMRAMNDTDTRHYFVTEADTKRLSLTLEKDASCKSVNSELRSIAGVTKGVEIAIGRGGARLISLLGCSTTLGCSSR